MKKYLFTFIIAAISLCVTAQEWHDRPISSVEEDAQRQTEMLVRELGIQDSIQRESVYQMFLKMTIDRRRSNTRAQELQRLNQMAKDLERILTPAQYDLFMNTQLDNRMQRPPMPFGPSPRGEEPNKDHMPPAPR